jgi:hypothetical protein
MDDDVDHLGGGIPRRFRDLSVDVREERVIRYIEKQLSLGRHMDDVMADSYVVAHTSEATRSRILQSPAVIRAVEEETRREFADYESMTVPADEGEGPDSEGPTQ